MTKEFVIWQKKTKASALKALQLTVYAHVKMHGAARWKWLTKPEVLHGDDGWRAYGRIEWSRR